MTETIIWTLVFFGGDLVVVLALIALAIKKDREKALSGVHEEPQTA